MEKIALDIADMKDDEVRIIDLDSRRSIIVVCSGQEFHAFKNICPHQSKRMGNVEKCSGSEIRCEHHGMKFDFITGKNTYSAGYYGIPSLEMLEITMQDGACHVTWPD